MKNPKSPLISDSTSCFRRLPLVSNSKYSPLQLLSMIVLLASIHVLICLNVYVAFSYKDDGHPLAGKGVRGRIIDKQKATDAL
ncbi:hypothetical protein CRG98_044897 [Punica granatum]|uniref:Transmembrane protein n=1 Tax=Punica granatum TaxID=22663 RepID=A0A2I0HSM1_PUNGR|nr:hypothetical protein CRG98_044897 [Punica granatum]